MKLSLKILSVYAIYFVVMFLFLGAVLILGLIERLNSDYSFLSLMNILVGLYLTGGLIIVFRIFEKNNARILGFSLNSKDMLFVLISVASLTLLSILFVSSIEKIMHVSVQFRFEKLSISFLPILLFGFIGWIISTSQEEFLNRGYMFYLLKNMKPLNIIILSSLLFSLSHIPVKGFHPTQLLIHFIGGISYGYVYWKSNSVTVSTIVHGTHNFLLDILFNNTYSVSLVSFSMHLTDETKLVLQIFEFIIVILLANVFYSKGIDARIWKKVIPSQKNI